MKQVDNSTTTYIHEIKQILAAARQKAYTAVNFAMVEAYWLIGKRIVEEEQHGKERAKYGEYVVREVSKALTAEFGKGFSERSVWQYRQFYLMFPETEIRRAPLAKLQSDEKEDNTIPRALLAQSRQNKYLHYFRRLNWPHIQRIMRVSNPKPSLARRDARPCVSTLTDETTTKVPKGHNFHNRRSATCGIGAHHHLCPKGRTYRQLVVANRLPMSLPLTASNFVSGSFPDIHCRRSATCGITDRLSKSCLSGSSPDVHYRRSLTCGYENHVPSGLSVADGTTGTLGSQSPKDLNMDNPLQAAGVARGIEAGVARGIEAGAVRGIEAGAVRGIGESATRRIGENAARCIHSRTTTTTTTTTTPLINHENHSSDNWATIKRKSAKIIKICVICVPIATTIASPIIFNFQFSIFNFQLDKS